MRPKALKPLDPIEAKIAEILRYEPQRRQRGLIKLLNRHPNHPRAWMELAELHHKERRQEEARHAAQRALDLDLEIFGHFSPGLRHITGDLITTARQRAEAEAERMAREARKLESNDSDDPAVVAARELQRILSLPPAEHAARLDILTRRFPDQPDIWMALAESLMVSRRLERALQAADRAIALDPDLEYRMSPDLEQARALYNRDRNAGAVRRPRPPSYGPGPRGQVVQVDFSPNNPAAQYAPPPNPVDPHQLDQILSEVEDEGARGLSIVPEALIGGPPGADLLGEPPRHAVLFPPTDPTLAQIQEAKDEGTGAGQALAHALERPGRSERLAELRKIYSRHPDHPAVLYHFAIHAALEGDVQNAQVAGDRLRVRSPERYRQLWEFAEQHWSEEEQEPQPSAMPTMMVQPLPAKAKRNTGVIVNAQSAPESHRRTVHLHLPSYIPPPPQPGMSQGLKTALMMLGGAAAAGILAGVLISLFA